MGPPWQISWNALTYFGKYLGRKTASLILAQYGPLRATDPSYIVADACLRCNTIRYAQELHPHKLGTIESASSTIRHNNPPNVSFHGADVAAVLEPQMGHGPARMDP